SLARGEVPKHIVDLEPSPRPAGITQVIGPPQLGQHVEPATGLEHAQQLGQPCRRHEEPQIVPKLRQAEDTIAQDPRRGGQGRGVWISDWFFFNDAHLFEEFGIWNLESGIRYLDGRSWMPALNPGSHTEEPFQRDSSAPSDAGPPGSR